MNVREILKISLNLVVIYAIGGVLLAFVYAQTSPIIFKNKKEDKERALNRMMPVHLVVNAPGDRRGEIKALLPEGAEIFSEEEAGGAYSLDVQVGGSLVEKLAKGLGKAGATEVTEYSQNKPEKAGDWTPWGKHAEFYEVRKDGALGGYIVEAYGKGYSSYPNMYVAVSPQLVVTKLNVLSHGETPGLGDEIMLDWFKDQFVGKDLDHLVVIKGETDDKIQAITGATISTRAVTNGVRDAIKMLREKYEGADEDFTWGPESGLASAGEGPGAHGGGAPEEVAPEEGVKDEH